MCYFKVVRNLLRPAKYLIIAAGVALAALGGTVLAALWTINLDINSGRVFDSFCSSNLTGNSIDTLSHLAWLGRNAQVAIPFPGDVDMSSRQWTLTISFQPRFEQFIRVWEALDGRQVEAQPTLKCRITHDGHTIVFAKSVYE